MDRTRDRSHEKDKRQLTGKGQEIDYMNRTRDG